MLSLKCDSDAQHSMMLPAGQPAFPPRRTVGTTRASVIHRDGYTMIPNTVLATYAKLGISEGEFVFIQQVWSYWWDETLPFPSVATLATRMGKSVRQIQHYIAHLCRLGLLRVVERRGPGGGQLSNAYDLQPLLDAVGRHAQTRREPRLASTVLGAGRPAPNTSADPPESAGGRRAGQRMPDCAPQGVHLSAPESTHGETDTSSISISMPPTPATSRVARVDDSPSIHPPAPPLSSPARGPLHRPGRRGSNALTHRVSVSSRQMPAAPAIHMILARLGSMLGDSAPNSSLTRALRLQARYRLEERAFIQAVDEVGRRVHAAIGTVQNRDQTGKPNAMPYFFASLERQITQPPRIRPCAGRRVGKRQSRAPKAMVPVVFHPPPAEPLSGIPVWDVVRAALRDTLAPGVYTAHVRPLRSSLSAEGALVLECPTPLERFWVESRLRARIEAALASLGKEAPRLILSVAGQVETPTNEEAL